MRLCALLMQVLTLDADRLRLIPHTPTSDTADAAFAYAYSRMPHTSYACAHFLQVLTLDAGRLRILLRQQGVPTRRRQGREEMIDKVRMLTYADVC